MCSLSQTNIWLEMLISTYFYTEHFYFFFIFFLCDSFITIARSHTCTGHFRVLLLLLLALLLYFLLFLFVFFRMCVALCACGYVWWAFFVKFLWFRYYCCMDGVFRGFLLVRVFLILRCFFSLPLYCRLDFLS